MITRAKKELSAKTVNRNAAAKTVANVHTLMEFVTACQAGQETTARTRVPTLLGETIANINANVSTTLVAVNPMDFASASKASWDKSVRKFVPKDFTVQTASRFVTATESRTRFAIQLMAASVSRDTKETTVTSRWLENCRRKMVS